MYNLFPALQGNEHIKNMIAADIRRGTFLHGSVFESSLGDVALEFAYQLAAALNCKDKNGSAFCGSCDNCLKILGRKCVDVYLLDTDGKATISVKRIREMIATAVLSPSELDTKVYIINHAEKLTVEAQNAFLKVLEEPPVANTFFIMLTDNAGALLPTIKSRAPVFRLASPDRKAAAEAVQLKTGISYEEALYAAAVAQNDIPLACETALKTDTGKQKSAIYEIAREFVELIAAKKSCAEILYYAASVKQGREDVKDIFKLIYSALRDIIAVKTSESAETDFYPTAQKARPLAAKITVRTAAAVSGEVLDALGALEKNAIPKNVLIAFSVKAHSAIFR